MFETILTLRESEDEELHDDADYTITSLGGNIAELMGDRMGDVIQEFIDNASLTTICNDYFHYYLISL